MTNEQLQHYKDLLITEKNEILKELVDSKDSSKSLLENDSNTVNDSVDEANTNITQNILNIVSTKNQQTLLAIDAALRRITEGSFGKCISCGREISSNRLDALPWATKCIECKNRDEKKK